MEKMHITLSNNIEYVKAHKLDAKSNVISVVVSLNDYENGVENPIFYAERYGMLYNPNNDFMPHIKGGNKLGENHVDFYMDQISEARKEYKRRLQNRPTNSGGTSSAELDELKETIKQKEIRIREQAVKIAELSTNGGNGGNGQTERLEALIELQLASIKHLSDMKPREIIVKIGEKENTVKADVLNDEYETILDLIADKQEVFLTGPAGTGKSKLAEQVAEGLGLNFYPESAVAYEHKLTGYKDANGTFHETAFYLAFKHGGLFMIDEIDASTPEVLVIINTALAQKYFTFNGEFVRAHEDFRCIVAGNTTGRGADTQYVGRFQLDASTIDRFMMIDIDYQESIEMAITNNDKELVEFAHSFRESADMNRIEIIFSYRGLARIATMKEKIALPKLLNMALLKGLAKDDIRMLARNMNIDSNNKYFKALKQTA